MTSRNTLSTFEHNFVFTSLYSFLNEILPHKLYKFQVPLNLDCSLAKPQM